MGIELLAALFIFVAVTALVAVMLRGSSPGRVAEQRIQGLARVPGEEHVEARGLLTRSGSSVPVLRNLTSETSNWATRTTLDLQRAGLSLKVSEYLLIRLVFGVLLAAAVLFLTSASPLGVVLGFALGAAGFWLPGFFVKFLQQRRQGAISAQLVETIQLISNALRSGFAFTQAIELAAKQVSPPIQDELHYFLRDNSLGAPVEDSLRAMVDRSGSLDLEMMVTSILVQRTTGGNLSEILDNVAETVRERYRLRGEMRALTASQRLTGFILSIYPMALLAIFFAIAPSVMSVLFTNEIGIVLLVIAGTLQVIGAIAIRRITTLDV